jgi:hypothetical protein
MIYIKKINQIVCFTFFERKDLKKALLMLKKICFIKT